MADKSQPQQTTQPSPRPPLCPEGTIIKGRWKIGQQIGMGAFGEIYVAKNIATEGLVAIKVEQVDEKKQALRAEVAILRKLQGCPYVCQFISCGRQDEINYLVMELLGENLSDLRKRQARCVFTMPTVCRLAVEMILAVESIHALGVLHRDVKPSNFVLGRRGADAAHKIYAIDFGLSRRFVGLDGETKPPRANAGFRGTARYASVNSHACRELAPRDDLWSVLYVLVEFATGTLPWRQLRDRDKVGEMKAAFMSGRRLVDTLPSEFEDFMNHLLTLDFYSRPNYTYCADLFRGLLARLSPNGVPPYDWERPQAALLAAAASLLPSTSHSPAPLAVAVPPASATATGALPTSSGRAEFPWPLFRRTVTKPHKVPVGSVAPSHAAGIAEADPEATAPGEQMTAGDGGMAGTAGAAHAATPDPPATAGHNTRPSSEASQPRPKTPPPGGAAAGSLSVPVAVGADGAAASG